MATMSSILVAGKALVAGQGGDEKGRAAALVATAALSLILAVGGIIGQGRQAAPAAPPVGTNPFAGDTHVYTMWDFREDRRAETRDRFVSDQFTYREDRRAEHIPALVPSDYVPDFWTYREDRRVDQQPAAGNGGVPSPGFGPQP